MDNQDIETLFSFEVHVESIKNIRACCRLPAVSFRLLDFPTLIIHHVSPGLVEKMREKVEVEAVSTDTVLNQLKDRQGNFQIQKGKSCLLKVNLNNFHDHLQVVPLYVMLIDLWPQKPKLVGSTTVSLKEAINKIYRDVSWNVVAVPAFYRDENTFSVYNLMGSKIAEIKLGYKLLSLGGALLPHVPRLSMLKRDRDKENCSTTKPSVDIAGLASVDISHKAEEKKKLTTEPPQPLPSTKLTEKQDVYVQTNLGKMQKKIIADDDVLVTNTVCPPPLYYNLHSDTKKVAVSKENKLNYDVNRKLSLTSESWETKSPSDIENAEAYFGYHETGVIQADGKVPCNSVAVQTSNHILKALSRNTGSFDCEEGNFDNVDNKQFPLLKALLNELQTAANSNGVPKETNLMLPKKSVEHEFKSKQNISKPVMKKKPLQALTDKKIPDTCKSSLFNTTPGKSSVVGLSRQRPKFRKTNLTYKMTKTQLMRLEMNQRSRQGENKPRRLCVAWAEDVKERTQTQRPMSVSKGFGSTYKIGLKKEVGAISGNDPSATKQLVSTQMQTEDSVHIGTSDDPKDLDSEKLPFPRKHRERKHVVASSKKIVHRDSNAAHSSVRGNSPVESNRSCKSQGSLDVYLPTMNGNSEGGSVTDEEDLSGSEDNHPRERDAYGYTGIPSLESSLGKPTFEDHEAWESDKLESCSSKVVISQDTQDTNDRTKVDIPGSSSDLLKGTFPFDQGLDAEHHIVGSDQEETNLCSREDSFAYSEDFVSVGSERSSSESSNSVGSVLKSIS